MMRGRRAAAAALLMLAAGALAARAGLIPLAVPYHNKKISHPITHIGFKPGEKLVYEFGWSGLSVARAEIHTQKVAFSGEEYYHIFGDARTYSVVDLLWKMRDSAEAYFRVDDLKPVKFIMHQRENSLKIDSVTEFLPDRILVHWNDEYKGKKKPEQLWEHINRGAFCPASMAFYTRAMDYGPGDEFSFEIIGGKALYLITFRIDRREEIEVEAGRYKALRVTPTMQKLTGRIPVGDERKFRSATLWVSDDEAKIPLKAESEVFIGAVFAELVEGPKTPARIDE